MPELHAKSDVLTVYWAWRRWGKAARLSNVSAIHQSVAGKRFGASERACMLQQKKARSKSRLCKQACMRLDGWLVESGSGYWGVLVWVWVV
jgi:hypothetical protein